jgi:hypothetical protein
VEGSSAGHAAIDRRTATWLRFIESATMAPRPVTIGCSAAGPIRLSRSWLEVPRLDFQVLTAIVLPEPTTPAIQLPVAWAESSLPKMYPCLSTWALPPISAV